ncbi:MFS transporter [Caulobacter sp. S45]|uniref:MFS transporter n=1 Tax=Caulobacter sp. S45 TaxID=1641861 RepID=UPI00131E0057|nr:MFS transporter [Caulobacter sp. S45]
MQQRPGAEQTLSVNPGGGWRALVGAALGSAFEWYDFFLYALLAVHFSALFFPRGSEASGLLFSLATFGAGFIVRPIGALVFGPLGDKVGRKFTFLITISLMGLSTAALGFVPTFAQIGWWAPALLVTLRLIQGLSVGGEYGGAATYVGEYAPESRRGARTGWLQMTVTGGQLIALAVIMACEHAIGPKAFDAWGWRLPFLLSIILLALSVWIRLGLEESPVFRAIQQAKRTSHSPLAESLGDPANLRRILAALILCAGQGVLGYTGALYPVFFLTGALRMEPSAVDVLVAVSILVSLPFQPFFGWLSDRFSRKWIMLTACLLAAVFYLPAFKALVHFGNPALETFQASTQITVASDTCRFRLFVTPATKLSTCDKAKNFLNKAGLNYASVPSQAGAEVLTTIAGQRLAGFEPAQFAKALAKAGYPAKPDPARVNVVMIELVLIGLAVLSAMVFGPLAAFLVEQFPPRIRYTSIGVAYNFGTGWFGGMTPFVVSALALRAGDIYGGLWAPAAFALTVFVLGALLIRSQRDAVAVR